MNGLHALLLLLASVIIMHFINRHTYGQNHIPYKEYVKGDTFTQFMIVFIGGTIGMLGVIKLFWHYGILS